MLTNSHLDKIEEVCNSHDFYELQELQGNLEELHTSDLGPEQNMIIKEFLTQVKDKVSILQNN